MLRIIIYNYGTLYFKLAKSLETVQPVPTTSTALTAHPFSKCTTMLNINTKSVTCQQYLAPSAAGRREFHSSESLNCGTKFFDGNQINHKTVEHKSSMETPHYSRDTKVYTLSCKTQRHCIRHSKSLNSLSDEITRSLHKEYNSFNNINEEEDYVVSMYFRVPSTDVNGYLKLLPDCNDYEEIDDKSVNTEPDYCLIGGIDAY